MKVQLFKLNMLDLVNAIAIEFKCMHDKQDMTKEVFQELKQFSLNSTKLMEWYDIAPNLCLRYDAKRNTIQFKEKNKGSFKALTALPSLLLRDWQIIDSEQKELLETFIEYSPLMGNSQQQSSSGPR